MRRQREPVGPLAAGRQAHSGQKPGPRWAETRTVAIVVCMVPLGVSFPPLGSHPLLVRAVARKLAQGLAALPPGQLVQIAMVVTDRCGISTPGRLMASTWRWNRSALNRTPQHRHALLPACVLWRTGCGVQDVS